MFPQADFPPKFYFPPSLFGRILLHSSRHSAVSSQELSHALDQTRPSAPRPPLPGNPAHQSSSFLHVGPRSSIPFRPSIFLILIRCSRPSSSFLFLETLLGSLIYRTSRSPPPAPVPKNNHRPPIHTNRAGRRSRQHKGNASKGKSIPTPSMIAVCKPQVIAPPVRLGQGLRPTTRSRCTSPRASGTSSPAASSPILPAPGIGDRQPSLVLLRTQ